MLVRCMVDQTQWQIVSDYPLCICQGGRYDSNISPFTAWLRARPQLDAADRSSGTQKGSLFESVSIHDADERTRWSPWAPRIPRQRCSPPCHFSQTKRLRGTRGVCVGERQRWDGPRGIMIQNRIFNIAFREEPPALSCNEERVTFGACASCREAKMKYYSRVTVEQIRIHLKCVSLKKISIGCFTVKKFLL